MLLGRLTGMALLVLATLMASAEAVMALSLGGHHPGLVAGDVVLLLWGHLPNTDFLPLLDSVMLRWPAWTVIAPLGLMLAALCRRRRRRHWFRA